MTSGIQLWHGDCLELLPRIPDGTVDMICADLPYGTTNCPWDKRLPMEPLWREFWRVARHNAAVCLFAQQPFATDLINAARKWFRYEWVWVKTRAGGPLNARRMPMRLHELVLVFYRALPKYNPQMRKAERLCKGIRTRIHGGSRVYGKCLSGGVRWEERGVRYPVDVVQFKSQNLAAPVHPTAKPVPLLEMLARTYTDEGELVLDPTMGSGSMGVACANAGRKFIGIEKDAHYYAVARSRLPPPPPRRMRKATLLIVLSCHPPCKPLAGGFFHAAKFPSY